jgi:cyclophilin family peptidyl-prolyl cis-trans isomerase
MGKGENIMLRSAFCGLLLLLLAGPAFAKEYVVLQTTHGDIKLELYADKAPVTVKNFLDYADAGYYEGTIFHRVIKDFMIQGGGFSAQGVQKETRPPIKNEADNGLKNDRGTIAMARTNVVDSATSQFFINLKDNGFLNHRGKAPSAYGYAVFGRVIEGMDVVDKIAAGPTHRRDALFQDFPVEPVVIKGAKRFKD